MALPLIKTSTLIDQINNLLESGSVSDFDLNYLQKEAEKVRTKDISDGDMLLGILASIRNDVAETRKRFKNALAYNSANPVAIFNYGHSLLRMGLFAEAISAVEANAENNIECAKIAAIASQALGLKAKARYFYHLAGFDNEKVDSALAQNEYLPSIARDRGFAAVIKSFQREPEIWKSLSTR